jgi:hypothetical protein
MLSHKGAEQRGSKLFIRYGWRDRFGVSHKANLVGHQHKLTSVLSVAWSLL